MSTITLFHDSVGPFFEVILPTITEAYLYIEKMKKILKTDFPEEIRRHLSVTMEQDFFLDDTTVIAIKCYLNYPIGPPPDVEKEASADKLFFETMRKQNFGLEGPVIERSGDDVKKQIWDMVRAWGKEWHQEH